MNGDGYSDIIVGADNYENGQTGEGAAFIYLGSPSGIDTTSVTILEGNQIEASMGAPIEASI